jgi:hypothetical protein
MAWCHAFNSLVRLHLFLNEIPTLRSFSGERIALFPDYNPSLPLSFFRTFRWRAFVENSS